ncbi:MAG: hypothetical protein WCJ95_10015 [Mariniphaga sp.]
MRGFEEAKERRGEGHDSRLQREQLQTRSDASSHALIISGIRRCGNSTLLFQMLCKHYKEIFYYSGKGEYDFLIMDKVLKLSLFFTLAFR